MSRSNSTLLSTSAGRAVVSAFGIAEAPVRGGLYQYKCGTPGGWLDMSERSTESTSCYSIKYNTAPDKSKVDADPIRSE